MDVGVGSMGIMPVVERTGEGGLTVEGGIDGLVPFV